MRKHTRVSLALTGLATVTALTISPTGASTAPLRAPAPAAVATTGCQTSLTGHYEVCFTVPSAAGDAAVHQEVKDLIASMGEGDSLHASIFEWNLAGTADAMVAAAGRGATVELVLDREATVSPTTNYETALAAGLVKRVCLSQGQQSSCTNAPAGINHNKFFLFRIDGVYSVVQTSMNFTSGQKKKSQNLLRVIGDQSTYGHFLTYWTRMRDMQSLGASLWTNNGSRATSYLYPRTDGTDNIAGLLSRVSCGETHRKILLMSSKYGGRADLSQQLIRLHNSGCDVRVILGSEVGTRPAELAGLPLSKIRFGDIHDKTLLIDGRVTPPGGTAEVQKITLTGSHNFNNGSLVNANEAILRVGDHWVHEQYLKHFEDVWTAVGATP